MMRRVLKITVAGGGIGAAYGYYRAKQTMGDDALARLIKYDRVALPAILEYKWEEARCEKLPELLPSVFPPVSEEEYARRFEVLHHKHAKPMFDIFMELGGFYYKSGQKIASNMAGLSPEIYVDTFQPFLNDIPPRDPAEIRCVIEGELGRPMDEVFASFDEAPIGCASIGQVHRATLKSTGRKVVVKVQNPEAERTFKGDVFALKVLVDIFMPQLSVAFDEIQKQFATEFDYRGECRNAIQVRDNLLKAGYGDRVLVPEVLEELCSEKLMVMEEVTPSTPLHVALDQQAEQLARQQGVTKKAFIEAEKAKMAEQARILAKQGRMADSVSEDAYDKYIRLQEARRGSQRVLKVLYNWTLGWFTGGFDMAIGEDVVVPLNAARLVNDLFAVHGHEVLIDGVFNGDPHPGNILCANGKLALIDYGQVKRLEERERLDLAKAFLLVEAAIKVDPKTNPDVPPEVHARARRSVVEHSRTMGIQTKHDLDETHYEIATVYLGRMDQAWLYPTNFIQWTDKMQERDPMGDIDKVDYLVMVNTASLMLRGLGEMLQQPRNVAHEWAPFARRALKEKGRLAEVEAEIASWAKLA